MAESANNGSADKWDPQGMASAGLKNGPVLAEPFNLKREVDRPANNGGLFGKVKSWLGETPRYVPDTSNSEKGLLEAVSQAPSGMFLDKDKPAVTTGPELTPEPPKTVGVAEKSALNIKVVENGQEVQIGTPEELKAWYEKVTAGKTPASEEQLLQAKQDQDMIPVAVMEKDPLGQVSGLLVEVDAKLGEKFKAPPANPNLSYVGGLGSIEVPDAATLEQVGQLDSLRQQLVKWQEILSPSKGLNAELLAPPNVIHEEKKTEIDKREVNIRDIRESKLKNEGFNGIDPELVSDLLRMMEDKQKGALEDLSRFEDKWIPQELRFTGENAGKDFVGEPKNDLEKKYKEQVEKWKETFKKNGEAVGPNKDFTPEQLAALQKNLGEVSEKLTGDKATDLGVGEKPMDSGEGVLNDNKPNDNLESSAALPPEKKVGGIRGIWDKVTTSLKRWKDSDEFKYHLAGGAFAAAETAIVNFVVPLPVAGWIKAGFNGAVMGVAYEIVRRRADNEIGREIKSDRSDQEVKAAIERINTEHARAAKRIKAFATGAFAVNAALSLGLVGADVISHGLPTLAGEHSSSVASGLGDHGEKLAGSVSNTTTVGAPLSGYGTELAHAPDTQGFYDIQVKVGAEGGKHFWDSMNVPKNLLGGTETGWTNGFGNTSLEDNLRSMVSNFGHANTGVDLGKATNGTVFHVRDLISNSAMAQQHPEIVARQMELIQKALSSTDGQQYAKDIVPLYRQLLDDTLKVAVKK